MQFSSKTRVRNAIWVMFILGTIYLAPHLAAYCPCKFLLSFSEAISAEIENESQSQTTVTEEVPPPESDISSKEASVAATSTTDSFGGKAGDINLGISLSVLENDLYIGSAVGKFPILVPPGRGGLSPNILLDYSSYRGNGWIGVGWDFNMGAIQRSTKKGVKYDANDYLSVMNGSSSELVPRTDWCTTCFGAKIEGAYARYYFNPSTNGWEVRTKDGKKHYFGTSPESRQDNIYGIFKWCLDRVEDTNGNFMTIIYLKHEGEIYLNRIDYTGNAGLSPTNSVLFYLEGRLDAPSMFNTNADVKTALRLKTIDVFAGGNRVRKYELEYDADQTQPEFQYSSGTGRSLLGTVKIFGDDGMAQLPPMTFGWSDPSPGFNATAQWAPGGLFWSGYGYSSNQSFHFIGDFNGDGKTDFMYWNNGWWVITSDGSGFNTAAQWSTNDGQFWNGWNQFASQSFHFIGDFNGDGKTDFMYQDGVVGGWWVLTSNGNGFNAKAQWAPAGQYWNGWNLYSSQSFHFTGDFNGDGKTDFMYWNNGWWVITSNGNGFNSPVQWSTNDLQYYFGFQEHLNQSFHFVGDFNGDGKTDFMYWNYHQGGWWVLTSNGNGFNAKARWSPTDGQYWNGVLTENVTQPFHFVGDFNGDGKTDFMYQNGGWYVLTSNGNGFNPKALWASGALYWSGYLQRSNQSFHFTGDFNGDGKTDFMYWNNGWYVITSNGNTFNTTAPWTSNEGQFWNGWSNTSITQPFHFVGDFNGDGKTDFMYQSGVAPGGWYVVGSKTDAVDVINLNSNGVGGTTTVNYQSSSAYTNTLLPFNLHAVSSISVNDGKTNTYATNYTYSGGYFDCLDREFRGFQNATAYQMSDPQHYETMTQSWFYQDYYTKGKMWKQLVTSTEGHQREVINHWLLRDIDVSQGAKFPFIDSSTSTVTDSGYPPYTLSIDFGYDDYLNLNYEGKSGSTGDESISTSFLYTNDTSTWILNKPTKIEIRGGTSNAIASVKWMVYDTAGNLWTEEVCKSDDPNAGCTAQNMTQNSVTEYRYDSYGNLSKIIDPRNFTSFLFYDSATQTHPYETRKCLNQGVTEVNSCTVFHKTITGYDPGTGNLLLLIPPHLQETTYSTTYEYDEFGRLKKENRPDGGWTQYFYLDFGNPDSAQGPAQRIRKQEHIAGGTTPDNYTSLYFDGLGRVYSEMQTGPYGNPIVNETWYNPKIIGRIEKRSNTFYGGVETPYYTEFTYDGFSRVIEVEIPDYTANTFVSTTYQGLKKVVTDQRNHDTSYTYDVHQRLKKVEDPYGTATEYSYDPLNNLKQVIAAVGQPEQNVTTMTYDSQSKKKTMNDPDMGDWTYEYDKSGNLISQTDPKNQAIVFQYDGLNRITRKEYWMANPQYNVTFSYDASWIPYSKGALYSVTASDGQQDFFTDYDVMQRVQKYQKDIDYYNHIVNIEKTYDSAGRVLSVKYLEGTQNPRTYSYEYDVAGNLLYLKDNATQTNMVNYSNFTALGQPRLAVFSSGVSTTYDYYPETGRLKSLTTTKLPGGTLYQNLFYDLYDEKGNIKTITERDISGNPLLTHAHTYDYLDRLETATGTGTSPYTRSYRYDRIGNIKSKSDMGDYTYDYGNKPHAVRSVVSALPIYSNLPEIRIDYNFDQKPTVIKKKSGENWVDYVRFTYDGDGQRVKKENLETGDTALYFGELYETRNGTGVIHLFAGSRRVASVWLDADRNPQFTQFYHPDHLGSANVVTDQNGNRAERLEYYPFGAYRVAVDDNPGFPDVFHTYTGQEEDFDLEFYNYKARLYDPILGRFISPDPVDPDPEDPQTLNRYAYVLNNPLKYVDPTGFSTWIDDQGFVDDVRFDGDFGIYQSLPFDIQGPPARVGETYFIDSFFSPDTHLPGGQVLLGQSIDRYVTDKAIKALGMSTDEVFRNSFKGKEFDIKDVFPGHETKSYHGFLFQGKYVSLREAGNILAGINAASHGLSFEDFQKGAGAYQAGKEIGVAAYRYFGITFGTAPNWGEKNYQRTRSEFGYILYIDRKIPGLRNIGTIYSW